MVLGNLYFIDCQPGKQLMMPGMTAISGFGLEFVDDDLIAAYGALRSGEYFGALDGRFADARMGIVTEDENLSDFHGFAFGNVEAIYVNNLSRCYPVLFSTCFNNRVNVFTLHELIIITI